MTLCVDVPPGNLINVEQVKPFRRLTGIRLKETRWITKCIKILLFQVRIWLDSDYGAQIERAQVSYLNEGNYEWANLTYNFNDYNTVNFLINHINI